MAWEELPAPYDVVAVEYEQRFLAELDGKPRDRALLEEFAGAVRAAGLRVAIAERRDPYPSESGTVRLYVEATKPPSA